MTSNYEIVFKYEFVIIVFIVLYYTNHLRKIIILLLATLGLIHLSSLQK